MGSIFKILACLILNILLTSRSASASLLKIFDKPHFYEITSNRDASLNGHNLVQLFTTSIFGDGTCGQKSLIQYASSGRYDSKRGSEIGKLFMFTAKPTIYSNDEQTLSFLIDFQFQTPQIPEIKGFEISIEYQDRKSCIQIVPLNSQNKPGRVTTYRFKIKDPTFMTIKQDKYSFYFGRANIKALIECEWSGLDGNKNNATSMNLCSAENTISPSVDIGILKIKDVNIDFLRPDLCTGHLMTQTCIMRYKPEDTNVIIMHPMPDKFNRVAADLNVLTYLEQIDMKKDLKLGQRVIQDEIKINYIESFHRQKMPNNIVFKFLNYPSDYLNYMSILEDPVGANQCAITDTSAQFHQCECNETCVDCYDYPNPKNDLHYISLSKNSADKYLMKSLHCSNEIYQAYSFDNVGLDKTFQNQLLDKPRISKETTNLLGDRSSSLPVYNKDSLPRICIDFFYANKKSIPIYNIKIIFNDVSKIGLSSIYNGLANYKLDLYKYDYLEKPDQLIDVNLRKLYKINLKLVTSVELLNLTSGLQVSGLKQGKYLAEVVPNMRNPLCPRSDMCVDEANVNNEFTCVECSKLIIRFELLNYISSSNDALDTDKQSEWSSRIEQLERKLKTRFNINQGRDVETETTPDLEAFIDSDDFYYCSQDNSEFEKIVAQSALLSKRNEFGYNGSNPSSAITKRDLDASSSTSHGYSRFGVYSALVTKSFDIQNLLLPYEASYATESILESPYLDSLTTVFICMAIIIFLLIFFIVFNILVSRIRNHLIFHNYKKTIVFYLSVFVEEKTQKEMSKVLKIYEIFFKKWLPNTEIHIIDYSTNASERGALIEKADHIFYVCGTQKEICYLYDSIHIGQNAFHHDYNKLHFVDKYRLKCTNVTFNKKASIISKINTPSSGTISVTNNCCTQTCPISHILNDTQLKENLHTIVNVGVNEAKEAMMNCSSKEKKALLSDHLDDSIGYTQGALHNKGSTSSSQLSSSASSTSSSSFTNSFSIFQENYKQYLKLPTENKLLIRLILCESYKSNAYDRYSLNAFSEVHHAKLGRFALKLLLIKMEHSINRQIKSYLKKNKCLLEIDKNIKFNSQPFAAQTASLGSQGLIFVEEVANNSNSNSKFQRVSFK